MNANNIHFLVLMISRCMRNAFATRGIQIYSDIPTDKYSNVTDS